MVFYVCPYLDELFSIQGLVDSMLAFDGTHYKRTFEIESWWSRRKCSLLSSLSWSHLTFFAQSVDGRRRGSERRAGSSGKISRSHSLEPPEQRSADKAPVEDLSFANVMLSWRERIAADAAKKATVDIAEVKTPSRSKSSPLKHRSQDGSPSTRNGEKRVGSSRVQEEEGNREDYDAASRNVLSDVAQENADEDRFKVVDRSKSDLQLSAKTAEALAAMETSSLDRVPAQVAILRSKRASGKSSRSKEKLRASHPADLRSNSTSISNNLETSTDQLVHSPSHSLNDSKTMSAGADSKAQDDCTSKASEDSSRVTPKKRKIAEPGVTEKVTLEVGVQGSVSNEEEDSTTLAPLQCTPVADCEAEEPQDAKVISHSHLVCLYQSFSVPSHKQTMNITFFDSVARCSCPNWVPVFLYCRWKMLLTIHLKPIRLKAFPLGEINVSLKKADFLQKGLTIQVQFRFLTAQSFKKGST